ncbi:MAG: response regulator transcription factor [Actinomycetota bacterium]
MEADIRILVVDESPGIAEALQLELPRRVPVSVLGPVPDALAALDAMDREVVDLVLVDLDRAADDGLETVRLIREGNGTARVLCVSEARAPEAAAGALAAGAVGVIRPDSGGTATLSALRRALAGELVLPAVHLPNLVDRLRTSREPSDAERLSSLTGREREILRSLADGGATGEIAVALGISPMTVQSHVKNILAKLGVHSKVEAVTLAWRTGLVSASRSG